MFACQYESNNCPCGPVGKNPLIPDDSPWFELLMRRMLICFVTFFTYIRTSKDFHFYLFFLDGNYRVFFTSQNTRKIPYSLNPVNKAKALTWNMWLLQIMDGWMDERVAVICVELMDTYAWTNRWMDGCAEHCCLHWRNGKNSVKVYFIIKSRYISVYCYTATTNSIEWMLAQHNSQQHGVQTNHWQ